MPPSVVKPPTGMRPGWIEEFVAENPGATPETAIQQWLLAKARLEGRGLGEVIRDAYSAVVKPLTEAVGEGTGRFFQGMVPWSGKRCSDPS